MRGMLSKIWIEQRWQCLGFCAGLGLIMALLTAILPKVLGDIHQIFDRLPFLKPMITALLGADPGPQLTGGMSQAFLWVHPTVLTLVWAHEVIYCTRTPAGEIDRGTIDFLLGLPVSRLKIFSAELIGWLVSGICILSSGYVGHLLVAIFHEPGMRPPLVVTVYIMANLLAVYLAVGGLTFLISSVSDRRGRAMGVVFAILLSSFLINFVAQFWDPFQQTNSNATPTLQTSPWSVENQSRPPESTLVPNLKLAETAQLPGLESKSSGMSLSIFSVLHYYRPAIIIQEEKFPWKDVFLLLTIAGSSLTAASICLQQRSICTV